MRKISGAVQLLNCAGDFLVTCRIICGAKRPCLPWKGRWLSVSETGGVCPSTERFKKTPQSAHSGCQLPFQGSPECRKSPVKAGLFLLSIIIHDIMVMGEEKCYKLEKWSEACLKLWTPKVWCLQIICCEK